MSLEPDTKCPECGKDTWTTPSNYRGLNCYQVIRCPHCNVALVSNKSSVDEPFHWERWDKEKA